MVATAPRSMPAAEGERADPMAQVKMERTRPGLRSVVAVMATRVLGALVVLILGVRAETVRNSKPHLRLGVGAAAEEEMRLVERAVITAGVAAAQP